MLIKYYKTMNYFYRMFTYYVSVDSDADVSLKNTLKYNKYTYR